MQCVRGPKALIVQPPKKWFFCGRSFVCLSLMSFLSASPHNIFVWIDFFCFSLNVNRNNVLINLPCFLLPFLIFTFLGKKVGGYFYVAVRKECTTYIYIICSTNSNVMCNLFAFYCIVFACSFFFNNSFFVSIILNYSLP